MARRIISKTDTVNKEMLDDGNVIQLVGTQNVDDILANTKALRDAQGDFDKRPDTGMKHVAEIPIVVWDDMCRRAGGEPTPEMIRAWCNDPDNACFRVSKGRL